jgi:hypothetical protein
MVEGSLDLASEALAWQTGLLGLVAGCFSANRLRTYDDDGVALLSAEDADGICSLQGGGPRGAKQIASTLV